MKAVVQRGFGGPEVLGYEDLPEPAPGPRDVLVRVAAVGLNRLDVLQRVGPPLVPGFSFPHVPGMDLAGTVEAVGHEVRALRVGTRVVANPALECGECRHCHAGDDGLCATPRVLGGSVPGGYAELCVVAADHLAPVPDDVELEVAATLPTVWATAWHALVTVGRLRSGETMLVHGAGSGLSLAALQLAVRIGAHVVVTGSSDAKRQLARSLGASVVLDSGDADLATACREAGRSLGGSDGVDLVLDHVGPALFETSILALAPRGRLLFCGSTTGARASFELPYAYHFGICLVGVDPYRRAEFDEALAWFWKERPEAVIDSRFALGDAAAAQRRLESGQAAGKVILLT